MVAAIGLAESWLVLVAECVKVLVRILHDPAVWRLHELCDKLDEEAVRGLVGVLKARRSLVLP